MADAAFRILVEPPGRRPGRHFVDDDVLRAAGVASFRAYNVDPDVVEPVSDFFIRDEASVPEYTRIPEYESSPDASSPDDAVVLAGGARTPTLADGRFLGAFLRRLVRRAERGVRLAVVAHARRRDGDDRIETVVRSALGADDDESDESDVRRRWSANRRFIRSEMRIPDVVSNVVDRFYAVDAVVDLLCPPKPETRDARLEGLSSASFDDVFDAGVRASFLVAREVLPHVAKSEGPRRFVSLCPPPRVSRRRSGSGVGAAIGLARAVRDRLTRRGRSRRVRRVDPPSASSASGPTPDERTVETSEMDDEENASAKAIDALAKATRALLARDDGDAPNANASASGSFFSLDDDEGEFETIAYDGGAAGFADVAEEVADWVVVDAVWL